MAYFRERLPKSVVNYCNDRIVRFGLNVIRSSAATDRDDTAAMAADLETQLISKLELTEQSPIRAHCCLMQREHLQIFATLLISPCSMKPES